MTKKKVPTVLREVTIERVTEPLHRYRYQFSVHIIWSRFQVYKLGSLYKISVPSLNSIKDWNTQLLIEESLSPNLSSLENFWSTTPLQILGREE